jgi:MATE family multidrug resistance protein
MKGFFFGEDVELIKENKKGSIIELFVISFPMMISQGCETIMIFTDRLFMSRLGPEQMSATMMGGLTVFVITTFFIGLTSYTNALTAQFYGAGRKKRCGLVVTQAGIVSLAGYPVILVLSPLVIRYFEACGIAPEQLVPQKTYFSIVIFSVIVSLFRNSLSGFFCGIGKTGFVMVAAVLSMVLNIAVDYVLIFGKFGAPALGIRGAAIGTIIGGFTGFCVLAVIYLKYQKQSEYGIAQSWRYDRSVMGKLIKFGYPAGLEFFLNMIAFNLMIMIFHADGLVTATAATIVFNWDLVSFVPLIGVQVGVTSLVGRYMGAGSPDTAHKVTISGISMGWCYSLMILVLFVFFTEPLVNVFRPHEASSVFEEAKPLAVFMIRLAAIYVMVDTLFAVITGALRGAGDTLWAMVITVILHWILVAILYTIMNVLDMSAKAGWVSVVLVFVSFSMLILWRYSTGKWRKINVVSKDEEVLEQT